MTDQRLKLGDYHLQIDPTSGLLTTLQLGDGPDALGHGAGPSPLLPAVDLAYQPLDAQPRYLSHELDDDELIVRISLGSLVLYDLYRVSDGLIERLYIVRNPEKLAHLAGLLK